MMPMLGSFVAKGKLAANALAFVSALNNVDFPTFGNPTIPHFKAILVFFKKKGLPIEGVLSMLFYNFFLLIPFHYFLVI